MVFQVPESKANLKKNRFEFKVAGEVLSLPKMDYMPSEVDDYLVSIQGTNLSITAYLLGIITACDPEVAERIRAARLNRDQIQSLLDAWREASKVTEGESSDSSKS
ncbi:hypothetical protein [Nocardia concava]|uniref:hypothetical protein n=1 Tax=Nocardia concava TaxID=257281 RepID=UPI000307599F|nr:hypothetical protein [Nocardia concava]